MNGTRAGDTAPGERRVWACPECPEVITAYEGGYPPHCVGSVTFGTAHMPVVMVPVTVVERAGGDEAAGFSEERSARDLLAILADETNWIVPANGAPLMYGHDAPWELAREVLAALAPAGSPEAKEQECSTDGVRFAMAFNEKRCERGNHEYGERGYCVNCGVNKPEEQA